MKLFYFLLFLFSIQFCLSQDSLSVDVDDRYREDQFYASITYNLLSDNPSNISSTDFSTGLHFGFIRDMPINKKRNWSVGLGFGISSNSYNQNLYITEDSNGVAFTDSDVNFGNVSKNKFSTYLIDVPFELRWRTSNATDYKFWRIYAGFKFSYLVFSSSRLESELQDIKLSNIDAFNRLQYGLSLSAGYGTWNFQIYYGLNPIFDDASLLNGQSIDSKAVRIGIMFYIL